MSPQFPDFDGRFYHIPDKEALRRRLGDFFHSCKEVCAAYLYGSLATREMGHDLDVGIFTRGEVDPLRLGTLLEKHLFEAGIRVPVDLRVLNEAPIWVQYEVIKEGICIYRGSSDETAELEARIILDYLDFQPVLESYNRAFWEKAFHEIQ